MMMNIMLIVWTKYSHCTFMFEREEKSFFSHVLTRIFTIVKSLQQKYSRKNSRSNTGTKQLESSSCGMQMIGFTGKHVIVQIL